MALTVSFAPAAPAPAARPMRAAALPAADSPEGFDAVLARTAEGPEDQCVGPVDAGDDLDEQEEPAEPVDVSGMTVCLDAVPRIVPPLDVVAPTSDSATETAGDGLPADLRSETVAAPEVIQPADTPAPKADAVSVRWPEAVEKTEVPGPRQTLETETPRVAPQGDVVGSTENVPAGDAPSVGLSTAASRTAAIPTPGSVKGSQRSEARAVAQAIVADALTSTTVVRPETAAQGSAVATAPLLPGQVTTGNGEAPQSAAKARPAQAPVDAPPVDASVGEMPVQAHSQGRREGGQGGQAPPEHGLPHGRALGLGHPGVPASMVFPGQATFAAAVERALPLGQAVPPGFTEPALATVVPQVVRSMHMQVTAGGGDMTLTLTPEHLGTVTIELRVDQQRVSANLGADTAAVRGWIAAHEQDLKAGLADLGLQLDEFVVRDEDPRERKDQTNGQSTPQRRKRERAEQPVFEVQA